MAILKIELITATFNGITSSFYTLHDFKAGSLQVFLNGQLKEPSLEDGFIELTSTKFKMKIAPQNGDVLQVAYVPI